MHSVSLSSSPPEDNGEDDRSRSRSRSRSRDRGEDAPDAEMGAAPAPGSFEEAAIAADELGGRVLTPEEAKFHDFGDATEMARDYAEMTADEDPGEDYVRPFWMVPRCGPGTCSKHKFPGKVGVWSYRGDSFCRWRYVEHLVYHGAHKMKLDDAIDLAFNEQKTKVVFQGLPFEDRQRAREYEAQNQGAEPYTGTTPKGPGKKKARQQDWHRQDRWQDMQDDLHIEYLGRRANLVPYGDRSTAAEDRFQRDFNKLQKAFQDVAQCMRVIPPLFRSVAHSQKQMAEKAQDREKEIDSLRQRLRESERRGGSDRRRARSRSRGGGRRRW